MDTFVKIFQEWCGIQELETDVNEYARKRNLEIISITTFYNEKIPTLDGSEALCFAVVYKRKGGE